MAYLHEYTNISRYLVAIFGTVVFWRNYKTSPFPGTTINSFNNVNHFLFVFQSPVDLVVVTSSQINHDMFVSEEKHDGARIVQFIPVIRSN